MSPRIVRDDIEPPTTDDLIVRDSRGIPAERGTVTFAHWVDHPIWQDRPTLGHLVYSPARPQPWAWITPGGYTAHADTRERALEDLLEDALGEYQRAGDVADRVRGIA